ncbi:enediyne biosynthesis protein UnbU [Streptosporangium sp. NBC_01469]|uniref:enediyne biosynthesis protein UnbU n=1 Tax=Streptosporangium sp. NBC_01469 TaxID=2903898 RepID=UPI002E2A042C|nr:enediyne biosynthesis protein UnbU [Streptosporangium sp. NBC_01469]
MNATRRRDKAFRRLAESLTLITVLGHTVLGFEQSCLAPVVGVLTGVTAEFALETVEAWSRRRPARYLGVPRDRVVAFLLPSYVCGLLCAMLLYGNGRLAPIALAVLIGVGGTYVFRVTAPGTPRVPKARETPETAEKAEPKARTAGRDAEDVPGTPFLNPAAFGIVAVLLLFPWVGLAPAYQFTAWVSGPFDLLVPLAVLVWGTTVNARLAGRLPLVLGWVGGFALQALVRGALTDVSAVGALLPMTGTAFALYTGYVIVDPGTSPARPRDQVVFGLATAAVYGLLVQCHVVFGLFLALVIVGAGRGLRVALPARLRTPGPPGVGGPAGHTVAGTSYGEISRCRDRPVRAPAASPPAGPP